MNNLNTIMLIAAALAVSASFIEGYGFYRFDPRFYNSAIILKKTPLLLNKEGAGHLKIRSSATGRVIGDRSLIRKSYAHFPPIAYPVVFVMVINYAADQNQSVMELKIGRITGLCMTLLALYMFVCIFTVSDQFAEPFIIIVVSWLLSYRNANRLYNEIIQRAAERAEKR